MVELACVPCRDQGLCGWPEPPTLLAGRGWRCKQPLESRHEPAEPAPRREPACCLRRRFKGLLSKLGLFSKTGKLLVLGLDNAGKSTLLTLLVRNEVVPHAPTHQPVTDMITIGSMKMRAVDMGGHEIARRMWEMYSQDADGIVYIVDAMDRERFPEAGLALHKLLQTLAATTPVLVLGNKDDMQGAAREEELYYCLGLDEVQRSGSGRQLQLQMCSVFEKRGFKEGFDWLSQHI